MSTKQRISLIIVLVVLVLGCLSGLVVSAATNGVNAENSPTLSFISGTGVTVILMLVGIIQNTSIHSTASDTKQLVNGSLEPRIRNAVMDVMKELSGVPAEPATPPVATPETTNTP